MAGVEWIKLYTDMFDNPKIKALRRLDFGNETVLIWIMLLTLAGRCNSNGAIFVKEGIPYTCEGLADDLRFKTEIFAEALKTLEEYGMISCVGCLHIVNWEEYQNVEGLDRIRKQTSTRVANYRKRHKESISGCNVTVTRCNATDKEIEEEKEKEIEINKRKVTKSDLEAVLTKFNLSEPLKEALRKFAKHRKLIKKPMTDDALELLIKKLLKLAQDETTQIAIIEQAITNGWLSVYPLKADARQGANGVKLSGEVDHTLDGIL